MQAEGTEVSTRFWQCSGMTLLSALVSAGFSLQGIILAGVSDSFAQYAASRSIALLIGAVYATATRSPASVAVVAIMMSLVQALDAVIGFHSHDSAKSYGPLLFSVLNIISLIRLISGQSPTSLKSA